MSLPSVLLPPEPLTPLHRDLMSAAARRTDHRLAPPERVRGGARRRLSEKLVALGLAEAVEGGESVWGLLPSGAAMGLRLTAAGLAIIGGQSDTPSELGEGSAPAEPRSWTKAARVLALLRRGEGADLTELVGATGWLPHTARAALTGLRRKGHAIHTRKRESDGRTVYRIAPAPTPPGTGSDAAPTASASAN